MKLALGSVRRRTLVLVILNTAFISLLSQIYCNKICLKTDENYINT
jgi:hypothetical protein